MRRARRASVDATGSFGSVAATAVGTDRHSRRLAGDVCHRATGSGSAAVPARARPTTSPATIGRPGPSPRSTAVRREAFRPPALHFAAISAAAVSAVGVSTARTSPTATAFPRPALPPSASRRPAFLAGVRLRSDSRPASLLRLGVRSPASAAFSAGGDSRIGDGLRLALGLRLLLDRQPAAHQHAGPLQHLAQPPAQLGLFADLLGEDMAGAEQGIGGRGHVAIRC